MVQLGAVADFDGLDTTDDFAVADVVHVHGFAFDAGDAGVVVAEFIHGEGDDVGEAGDERGEEHLGVAHLAVERGHFFREVFAVELRHVAAHGVGHEVDFAVALADVIDGAGVVADLALLDARELAGEFRLVTGDELQHAAL